MKLYSIFLILFLQCNAHDINDINDDDDRYTDVFEYNIDYKHLFKL